MYNNCCCRNTMGICRKIIAYLCGQRACWYESKQGFAKLFGGLLYVCVGTHFNTIYTQREGERFASTHTLLPSAILILCQISETQLNAHVSSWQMANNQKRKARQADSDRERETAVIMAGDKVRWPGSAASTNNRYKQQSRAQNTVLHDSQLNHNNSRPKGGATTPTHTDKLQKIP